MINGNLAFYKRSSPRAASIEIASLDLSGGRADIHERRRTSWPELSMASRPSPFASIGCRNLKVSGAGEVGGAGSRVLLQRAPAPPLRGRGKLCRFAADLPRTAIHDNALQFISSSRADAHVSNVPKWRCRLPRFWAAPCFSGPPPLLAIALAAAIAGSSVAARSFKEECP